MITFIFFTTSHTPKRNGILTTVRAISNCSLGNMAKGSIFGRKKSASPSTTSSKKSLVESIKQISTSSKSPNSAAEQARLQQQRTSIDRTSVVSSKAGNTGCGPRLCGTNKQPNGSIRGSKSSSLNSGAILEVYQDFILSSLI